MLADADRTRLLELMGVPVYVLRTRAPETAVVPETPATKNIGADRKPLAASAPVPVIGTSAGQPGIQRDLLRLFGQAAVAPVPREWPGFAVVLGDVGPIPPSTITIPVHVPLAGARAKRSLWRQLRPLLAERRPR